MKKDSSKFVALRSPFFYENMLILSNDSINLSD